MPPIYSQGFKIIKQQTRLHWLQRSHAPMLAESITDEETKSWKLPCSEREVQPSGNRFHQGWQNQTSFSTERRHQSFQPGV